MEFTRPLQFQFPLMRGDDVLAVQQALATLNVTPPCGNADGVYGSQTSATVQAFQKNWNVHVPAGAQPLDIDGKVGASTWAALFNAAGDAGAVAPHVMAATATIPPDIAKEIPLTKTEVGHLKHWMLANFKSHIDQAITGTPIDFDLVCAIAAKESAIYWINFINRITPADILSLCVFDATGDAPGTENQRSAFPVNAAALRHDARYGDAVTDMLIAESNKMRRVLRGFGPASYLYKGYGIFQYDLQNIVDDYPFFDNKLWYTFDNCIARLMKELREKLQIHQGLVMNAVRAYNGSGDRADKYVRSVMILREWCAAIQ
jgi:hypothetical protein